jgi:hypothetical protein
MKRSSLKILCAMAVALGLSASAKADLLYTFDTSASGTDGGGFNGGSFAWDSTYQAVQATTSVGGWTLGGTGPKFEFSWPSQTIMQGIAAGAANGALARIEFDVTIRDPESWNWINNGASDWYQLYAAGNSDGAGWTQLSLGSYNWNDQANLSLHFDYSFAEMGWTPGATWFQVFFGGNSDAGNGVDFYIDNIHVVPEPTTFALAGLGAAALLIFRRRK